MRSTKAVLGAWILVLAASAAKAGDENYKKTIHWEHRECTLYDMGIQVCYETPVTVEKTCMLGAVAGSCHGCDGACTGHYLEIDWGTVASLILQNSNSMSTKFGAGISGVPGNIPVSASTSVQGSSSNSSESSQSVGAGGSVKVGTDSHAPVCHTWQVKGEAKLRITMHLTRIEKRLNLFVNLYEEIEYKAEGPPVSGVEVKNTIKSHRCCCASRASGTKAGRGEEGFGGRPDPFTGPPGGTPKETGKKGGSDGRGGPDAGKAGAFLAAFDPNLVGGVDAKTRERFFEDIARCARRRGIDLESVPRWRERFLAGAFSFGKPAVDRAMYLGKKKGTDRFVLPARFEGEGTLRVEVDGKALGPERVSSRTARDGARFTLVETRIGPRPRGARIRVTAVDGRCYEGERPPDRIVLSSKTQLSRGPKTTTIEVVPEVKTVDPEGVETVHPAGKAPGAETPRAQVEDDEAFFRTLFDLVGMTANTLVSAGTTYLLLSESRGPSGGGVRTKPDGTTTMEMPNEAYDQAMETTQRAHPDFDHEDVADSVSTGLQKGVAGIGDGITVNRVLVPGGSPDSLEPGAEVVFLLVVDEKIAGGFRLGSVRVDLVAGGVPAGCMLVHDASADPSTGAGSVVATLPAGVTSPDGSLEATICAGEKTSNPVPLRLHQDVEVSVSMKVAPSGTSVTATLTSTCNGSIHGFLRLTGPGTFVGGGQEMRFDAWGTATAEILTANAGQIAVTFHPDEGPGAVDEMKTLFD